VGSGRGGGHCKTYRKEDKMNRTTELATMAAQSANQLMQDLLVLNHQGALLSLVIMPEIAKLAQLERLLSHIASISEVTK